MTDNKTTQERGQSRRPQFDAKITDLLSPLAALNDTVQLIKERVARAGLEFPLTAAKSMDGMLSYLTRKHSGNVHKKGIDAIYAMSVHRNDHIAAVCHVTNLTDESIFSVHKSSQINGISEVNV